MVDESDQTQKSPPKLQIYLFNIVLVLLITYLVFALWDAHNPAKAHEPVPLARLNDYGQPAFIGNDLKHLVPYDIKLPFAEGVFLLEELGGHMIFTMDSQVEVSLKDKVLLQFRKEGLELIEGEITSILPFL